MSVKLYLPGEVFEFGLSPMITPFGLVCFWGPGCLCASGSHGFLLVLGPACLPRKGKIRCIAASRAATDLILSMGRMRKKGCGTPRRRAARRRTHKGQTGCPVDVGHVRKGRHILHGSTHLVLDVLQLCVVHHDITSRPSLIWLDAASTPLHLACASCSAQAG